MFRKWIRHGLILTAIGLFAAGCASTPLVTAVPSPKATPIAPTAASRTASPAKDPPSSTGSGGNIVRLVVVPARSEARYRVREQLVGVSLPSDAIGRTQAITGSIVGKTDGTIVSAESKFVIDLRTLQSNDSRRDNFLRGNVLQTNRYPNAVFVPIQAPGLALTQPPSGQVAFKLIGDLTIRNVTKSVTWDLTCQAQGNEGTCHATTSFQFEYFDLTPPRVPVVLSVEDNIRLEADLVLQRVNG